LILKGKVLLSFALPDEFVEQYVSLTPYWGFKDAGGNSLGELAFVRSYSRVKPCDDHDSLDDDCPRSKERWYEVCRRVIEGMYHEQRKWCDTHRIPWDYEHALDSAMEAYDLLFHRKWAPPGRGLAVMGTAHVHLFGNSAALQNCAFVSTLEIGDDEDNPAEPFVWLMEASMLGVGVGFDTLGADLGLKITSPLIEREYYIIPDTREGWCESVRLLINSYLLEDEPTWEFDYSLIRPAGAPIKTFGGTAAGPGPLIELHDHIRRIFGERAGQALTSTDITDMMNLIGKCVVSGNVRRSAEIAIGHPDDKAYLDLKDWEKNPERMDKDTGWGWTSNNSVFATVGMDYRPIIERVLTNGEPGLVWMDVTRRFGRLADPEDDRDARAQGYNPCGEQPLESREMCTLVNLYPPNCADLYEFKRAIKFAYLYAKTVTLIATHWPRTNAIMQRNRRIGASFNGAWQFVEQKGYVEFDKWADEGFAEIIRRDRQYSEWLCARESIRHTTVKPDGTGGLLAGVTPGAHANPGGEFYLRRIRYAKDDPIIPLLKRAGYHVEPAKGNLETTVVAEFPIAGPVGVRSQSQASVYEKVALAARMQRYWSDNSVSFTLTYDPETEAKALQHILSMFEGQLKTISFLPQGKDVYPQMPYEEITREEYEAYTMRLFPVDWDALYDGDDLQDVELERGCTTDVCEIKAT
jgi:ribonucleoside-triphosphate reductase